jgi:hypothetical protein
MSIQQLTGIAFAAVNNMIDFSAGEEDPWREPQD